MDYKLLQKYHQGNCTHSERNEVEQWLSRPDVKDETDLLYQLWNEQEVPRTEEALHYLLRRIDLYENETQKPVRRIKISPVVYRMAGMFLLPILVTCMMWLYLSSDYSKKIAANQTKNIEYVALPGEHRTIVLSDGTTVNLNAGSVLIAPDRFAGKDRKVFLLGEGYFDVAKNKEKPFIVNTSLMNVEALGTRFSISAYQQDKHIRTTLVDGAVRVSALQNENVSPVILTPAQQASYSADMDFIEVKKVNTYLYTSWKDGRYLFEDSSIDQVVDRLEKQFNVKIQYTPSQFRFDKINAKFRSGESLSAILDQLSYIAYFQYKQDGNIITLNKKKR